MRRLFLALAVGLVVVGVALAQGGREPQAGPFDLSWWTVDAGGGGSSGGPFVLIGAIGQPDAEVVSGGQIGRAHV